MIWKVALVAVPVILAVLWFLEPISLSTADIGRHIANGWVYFQVPEDRAALLSTNYFSKDFSEYPFVNHHWLSGIVFFLLLKSLSWTGLHFVFIVLSVAAFLLFLTAGRMLSSWKTSALLSGILLPLYASRTEVRPEVFGYLFSGIFVVLLLAIQRKSIHPLFRWILPVILIAWVNLHASFPVGMLIIASFVLMTMIRRDVPLRSRLHDAIFLIVCIAALFLNPNGWRGVLEPFLIAQKSGYPIYENQSIISLLGAGEPAVWMTIAWTTIFVLLVGCILLKNRRSLSGDLLPILILTTIVGIMAWTGLRYGALFALVFIPTLAALVHTLTLPRKPWMTFLLVLLILAFNGVLLRGRWFALGLAPGTLNASALIKSEGVQGPYFNNYDFGGYFIFTLYPQSRPFVDNRAEAFPKSFFTDLYIPMLTDEAVWREELKRNRFNAILFTHLDRTSWAQGFLARRLQDPEWAPIFYDKSIIIFARRSENNRAVIEKYETRTREWIEEL